MVSDASRDSSLAGIGQAGACRAVHAAEQTRKGFHVLEASLCILSFVNKKY